mgnify:CR=1 FL=1
MAKRSFFMDIVFNGSYALLCVDFLQETVGVSPFVHQVEHIADVYTDTASQALVEIDIRAEAVPVAIEGKTYQLTLAVEHRATRVTASNIVVGEEAELHLAACLVTVLAERIV